MDAKLASIDAAGWNEENTLETKGFLKNRFTKISDGCPIANLKKSIWKSHFYPKFLVSRSKFYDAPFVSDWTFVIWWPNLLRILIFKSTDALIPLFFCGKYFYNLNM